MRIEQREDIVIIDGLEISGTIQKSTMPELSKFHHL